MQEHSLSTARTARYFTIGTLQGASEVWFVCHGYGQLASRFLERFRPLESEQRCIVAPEGLSRFYLTESPTERRVGASWMTREDRLHEIDDYVHYLDAVYGDLKRPNARVTALGFSQGSATACRWAAFGSARIDRLIVWGGEVPPDLDWARARDRLARTSLILVAGSNDRYITPKVLDRDERRLREHGIACAVERFEGGHEIIPEVLTRIL